MAKSDCNVFSVVQAFSIPAGQTREIACDTGFIIGKYVFVIIPGKSRILTLCEVEVYGVACDKDCFSNWKERLAPAGGAIQVPGILFGSDSTCHNGLCHELAGDGWEASYTIHQEVPTQTSVHILQIENVLAVGSLPSSQMFCVSQSILQVSTVFDLIIFPLVYYHGVLRRVCLLTAQCPTRGIRREGLERGAYCDLTPIASF